VTFRLQIKKTINYYLDSLVFIERAKSPKKQCRINKNALLQTVFCLEPFLPVLIVLYMMSILLFFIISWK